MTHRHQQRGFAYIAAIVLLVVMAALATAMVRLNTVQQNTSNQDLLGVRASQAARAGVEWGLYQLRSGGCQDSRDLSDFSAASGFTVTVACTFIEYREGESTPGVPLVKRIYRIDAVACNLGASCPDNTKSSQPDYVERRRVATACMTEAKGDCY
ncbi:MAG: MSHA biogenesis protein MshP [Massilia sp.]